MRKQIIFGTDLSDVNNFNENLVIDLLNKVLSQEESICRCQNCLEDMYSLSLKLIEPRYHPNSMIEQGSDAYMLTQSNFNESAEKEVRAAIEVVRKNPHH